MKKHILFLLISSFVSSCQKHPKADFIFYNGHIYTVDSSFSVAEAMAIKDGKILATGTSDSIRRLFRAPENIDLKERFVYPGFNDAHAHFYWYSIGLEKLDLTGTRSFYEVISKVKAYAENNSTDFITGRGWDQNDWSPKQFPNKEELDAAFPETPVFLKRIDGHAALANQAALDYAGIDGNTTVEGGIIQKENGELTGILIDNAIDLVQPPAPSREEGFSALQKAQDSLLRKGVTSVTDAGLNREQVDLIHDLHTSGDLKLRVNAMVSDDSILLAHYLDTGIIKTERLSVRTFKFYLDGALGSRGALMLKPYIDDSLNYGLMLSDRDHFLAAAARLKEAGWQMAIHAIGDSANRLALEVYEEVLEGATDHRWRIEHAQIVHPIEVRKFGRLEVIPSVQPTHATSDMYWAQERLGKKRMSRAYPYKDLLRASGILALGTDFPIEDFDPMKTFAAAVFRQDSAGYPEGGFRPDQGLSPEEALRGITIWGAYAAFEDREKGSLEPGKYADFVILDTDLMNAGLQEVLPAKVLKTYINGELLYDADGKGSRK